MSPTSQFSKKLLITFFSLLSIIGYGFFAFATINPGDTLDPVITHQLDCPNGPSDPTCIVKNLSADNGLTATGNNISLGGELSNDTVLNTSGHMLRIGQPIPDQLNPDGFIEFSVGYDSGFNSGSILTSAYNDTTNQEAYSVTYNQGGSVGSSLVWKDHADGLESKIHVTSNGVTLSYFDESDINNTKLNSVTVSNTGVQFSYNDSDSLTILENGKVGIGIDNFEDTNNQIGDGEALLQVNGKVYTSNDIYVNGNVLVTSDQNLKSNIVQLSYGLDTLNQLNPVSYNLISNGSYQLGFLAQEVQTVIPELVSEGKHLSLNYIGLTPVLVKAIQELNLKVDMLQLGSGYDSENIFVTLKDWLGNVGNGINRIFAKEIRTEKLCVGNTCVTESELQVLLDGQDDLGEEGEKKEEIETQEDEGEAEETNEQQDQDGDVSGENDTTEGSTNVINNDAGGNTPPVSDEPKSPVVQTVPENLV